MDIQFSLDLGWGGGGGGECGDKLLFASHAKSIKFQKDGQSRVFLCNMSKFRNCLDYSFLPELSILTGIPLLLGLSQLFGLSFIWSACFWSHSHLHIISFFFFALGLEVNRIMVRLLHGNTSSKVEAILLIPCFHYGDFLLQK